MFVCLFVRYLLSPCNSYHHQIFCGTSPDLEEGREGVGGVGGGGGGGLDGISPIYAAPVIASITKFSVVLP